MPSRSSSPPAIPPNAAPRPVIGVFDSGIGGLSVLAALRHRLPEADITYIADSRFTPWGERGSDWVRGRCLQLAAHLIDAGSQLVLVACNTGTTQAIAALRARWPQCPFVGVEPGIKPAAALSRHGRVAVMATTGTINSPRLAHLVATHAGQADVLRLPCPGLVEAIEQVDDDPAALDANLDGIATRLRDAGVDTVVLGCTHYPLVAAALQQRLGPGVRLVDTGEAVARRVASLLDSIAAAPGDDRLSPLQPDRLPPEVQLLATGDTRALQAAARRWLRVDARAQPLQLPDPQPAGGADPVTARL